MLVRIYCRLIARTLQPRYFSLQPVVSPTKEVRNLTLGCGACRKSLLHCVEEFTLFPNRSRHNLFKHPHYARWLLLQTRIRGPAEGFITHPFNNPFTKSLILSAVVGLLGRDGSLLRRTIRDHTNGRRNPEQPANSLHGCYKVLNWETCFRTILRRALSMKYRLNIP